MATTVGTFAHTNQLVVVKPVSTLLENSCSVELIAAKDLGVLVQVVGLAAQITVETELIYCDKQTDEVAPDTATAS